MDIQDNLSEEAGRNRYDRMLGWLNLGLYEHGECALGEEPGWPKKLPLIRNEKKRAGRLPIYLSIKSPVTNWLLGGPLITMLLPDTGGPAAIKINYGDTS